MIAPAREPEAAPSSVRVMTDSLTERFEENRAHLRSVAYRILGSLDDADDAVQEAWLRLSRHDAGNIDNLGGWLTTVVSRICIDMLRARRAKHEEALPPSIPDFVISREANPEDEAVTADSVGLATLVLLDSLSPSERLAFVLHDMYAVPFEDIAPIVDKSPAATRQLASRARRRVQDATPPRTAFGQRRAVVDSFLAAVREGNLEKVMGVLDPNILLRSDSGPALAGIRGAAAVAGQAVMFSKMVVTMEPVVVNGEPGSLTWLPNGDPLSVLGYVVEGDRITEMYVIAQPERLKRLVAL